MNDRTDIAKLFNKNQRKLLQDLKGQVKDLNDVLKMIAECQNVESVRKEHMDFLGIVGCRTLNDKEIAQAKDGGISFDDLRRIACKNMDVALGRESVREKLANGHIFRMMIAEHEIILYHISDLELQVKEISKSETWSDDRKCLVKIATLIRRVARMDGHKEREEQVLFPQMEACGFQQIPKLLAFEHANINRIGGELNKLTASMDKIEFRLWVERLEKLVTDFAGAIKKHIHTEESVLYPNAIKLIQDPHKWARMKDEYDQLASCFENN